MAINRKEEINGILEGLGVNGAAISLTNNGHYQVQSDLLNRLLFTGSTPSDHRGNLNFKSEVRREIKAGVFGRSKGEGNYNPEEIKQILKEFYGDSNLKAIKEKYKISGNTLQKWRKATGEIIPGQGKNRGKHQQVSSDTKNAIIRRTLKGESIPDISKDYPKLNAKSFYGWTAHYKKHGFYTAQRKPAQKADLARDISHMTSGKKEAHNNSDFDNAMAVLMGMGNKNKELIETIKRVEAERDELKAKLALISEAMSL